MWRRCADKCSTAKKQVDDRKHCREAWMAAGFGVEFALKAVIMTRERMNSWPSKDHRPDLYVHGPKALFRAAKIDPQSAPPAVRAAIRQVMDWDRGHDYVDAPMPRKQAQSMVDAAFGINGVVRWLKSL